VKLPLVVLDDLAEYYYYKWKTQMSPVKGRRDRTANWMLWYKFQNEGFLSDPEWQSPNDKRRRLIQFVDQYDVIQKANGNYQFIMTAPYFWVNYVQPKEEIELYHTKLQDALRQGEWLLTSCQNGTEIYARGDLELRVSIADKHPIDIEDRREFPLGYVCLEATIQVKGSSISQEQLITPWNAVRSEVRKPDTRGNPTILTDLAQLKDYFPMQVQLGAGSSIHAGIPPLHRFHELYKISDTSTKTTLFNVEKDDALIEYITNPEKFLLEVSQPYASVLRAEPTIFHHVIEGLFGRGDVVGPIITNNYDGLPYLLGLEELFVRKLAASQRPEIQEFDPKAKSLLVVGEHADRRLIQHYARDRGLKVIYLDPEGFEEKGKFIPYPLESPQTGDILIRMTGSEFGERMNQIYFDSSIKVLK
jgi:hypothetical protein